MARNVAELLEAARSEVPEVTADDVHAQKEGGDVDLILDVRDAPELSRGAIPGSIHVSRGLLEFRADPGSPAADERIAGRTEDRIVVVCASGGRSLLAAHRLKEMGFQNVSSLAGGFKAWREAGLPTKAPE